MTGLIILGITAVLMGMFGFGYWCGQLNRDKRADW